MNKILFSFLLLYCFSVASAQNSAVTNAILYHKDGLLDKSKQEIDQAIGHDKTKGEPKAWYYKGVIYTDIFRSTKPEYKSLTADPIKESYDAFTTAMKLDPSKGEYYKLSESKLQELWGDVINKGVAEYEAENSNGALVNFEMAQRIKPEDTTAYIYALYASESLGDNEKLKKYTNELVKLNYKSTYVYRNRIQLESDPVKKLEIAKQAIIDFPKDEALTEILGDIYASEGKYQEALNSYKILNGWMPEHTTVLIKMALQHEKLNNPDQALELYKKILGLEKQNFIANYNAAIIYFEKGKELNNKIHKLSMDEYHKKGKVMEDESKVFFTSASDHARSALLLTSDEVDKKNINLIISESNKVLKK